MDMRNRVMFRKTYESKDSCNDRGAPNETCWHHSLMNGGSISVVERLTGFGWWDIETGYRSPCGQFWLASGDCDIRDHLAQFSSEDEMIEWVIRNANNCTGGHLDFYHRSWTVTPARFLHNVGIPTTQVTP